MGWKFRSLKKSFIGLFLTLNAHKLHWDQVLFWTHIKPSYHFIVLGPRKNIVWMYIDHMVFVTVMKCKTLPDSLTNILIINMISVSTTTINIIIIINNIKHSHSIWWKYDKDLPAYQHQFPYHLEQKLQQHYQHLLQVWLQLWVQLWFLWDKRSRISCLT